MARTNKGPRLERNARGVWEVRWTEAGRSRRISARTGNRDEAARFLAGFILEEGRQREPEGMTAGAAINLYLSEHVDGGPVVDKARQHVIGGNLKGYFAGMAPEQITVPALKQYARLRAAGSVGVRPARSPSTIRRELNVLKAAFNYAAKTRRMAPGDVPFIPLPEETPPRDLWLDEQEIEQFKTAAIEHGSDRGRLFVLIAANTASRKKAVETLTWRQVDLTARLIHFNPQGRSQTKKRRVAVPINDELLAALQAVPEQERGIYVLGHPGSITRAMEVIRKAAAKDTGNPKFLQVTPHTLRHTWATLAARRGVQIYEIAAILGDTVQTCTSSYLHHCPDYLRHAVEEEYVPASERARPDRTPIREVDSQAVAP